MTIRAIYENGVFRPAQPVDLPDKTAVEVDVRAVGLDTPEAQEVARKEIFEILSRSYDTGQTDTAARHDEHQP
jgi:predicted DNA-binding antitoxin AbrB/MazE fold protein